VSPNNSGSKIATFLELYKAGQLAFGNNFLFYLFLAIFASLYQVPNTTKMQLIYTDLLFDKIPNTSLTYINSNR